MLRMLQVPELKRAMGFDETFRLERGSRRDRIKLLGNGVCPQVIRSIVETVAAEVLQRGDEVLQRGDDVSITQMAAE